MGKDLFKLRSLYIMTDIECCRNKHIVQLTEDPIVVVMLAFHTNMHELSKKTAMVEVFDKSYNPSGYMTFACTNCLVEYSKKNWDKYIREEVDVLSIMEW